MGKTGTKRSVSPKVDLESEFEEIAAKSMVFTGLDFEVGGATFHFPIQRSYGITDTTFRPDFKIVSAVNPLGERVSATIEGKSVFLEVHGSRYFDDAFVAKLYAFMQSEHHKDNYIVLAMDRHNTERVDYVLQGRGLKMEDIADKFWYLDVWENSHQLLPKKKRYIEHMNHLAELKRELDEMKVAQLVRA